MEEKRTESEIRAAVEAILFAAGDSVENERLAEALELDKQEMNDILKRMALRYEEADRGIRLVELSGAWQLCTKTEHYEELIRVVKQPKKTLLTDVLLETLSIVAYKQPVTRLEVEKIRGVKSDHAVNKLVEYGLIEEVGRMDAPGRPILFGTTEEFLRRFGVGSVQDLPDVGPEQEAEIKAQVEEELQLKLEALPDGTGQEMAEEAGQEMPEGLERPEEAEALRLKEAAATSEE